MPVPPSRCAAALIVDDRLRIFVQRRAPSRRLFPSCWDVVGGHVEPGETVDEALRREVREETGWTVAEVLAPVGEYAYRGDDGIDRLETDLLVRVSGDLGAPVQDPREHTEYRWLTRDELDLLDERRLWVAARRQTRRARVVEVPASGDWLLRKLVSDGFAALDALLAGPVAPAAGLFATAVDRAFIDAMRYAGKQGGPTLRERYGRGVGMWLIEFRTSLATPGRVVTAAQLAAITRYRDPRESRDSVRAQAEDGWLELEPDGGFRASGRGLEFLRDLWEVQGEALSRLWPDRDLVGRLNERIGRVLTAAMGSGGDALRAMAPPHEPADAPPQVTLLNRLGALRYHRSDAHAAAWTAAGLTAAEIQQLAGPEREAIEAETNRLAAPPYCVLSPEQRVSLLADLAVLPGQRGD